jgi:D-alanine-D-alanine ligase
MAEKFISCGPQHPEFTCAILGRCALPTIRIEPDGEFYDYHAKYISNDTRYTCPSGLSDELESRIQEMCVKAFEQLGARGWGRIDFLLDEHREPWLLEANLVPGMTSHSLMPMAARAAGIGFAELVWRILADTLPHPLSEPEGAS